MDTCCAKSANFRLPESDLNCVKRLHAQAGAWRDMSSWIAENELEPEAGTES